MSWFKHNDNKDMPSKPKTIWTVATLPGTIETKSVIRLGRFYLKPQAEYSFFGNYGITHTNHEVTPYLSQAWIIGDIEQAIKLADLVGGELLQVEVRETSVARSESEED